MPYLGSRVARNEDARLLTGRMPDDELVVGAESEELTAFENQQAAEKRS